MTEPKLPNRRKFDRYNTDVKLKFSVTFDLDTRIQYKVEESEQLHGAVGRNISVEGLCFAAGQKLRKGEGLMMFVYVPAATEPITMTGHVVWCDRTGESYETGVRIETVNDENVEKSIIFDKVHNVNWSIVLETVFGSFKHWALERNRRKQSG